VNLPELQEDPIEIINKMRSLSPPPSNTDLINSQKRSSRQKRVCNILSNIIPYILDFYTKQDIHVSVNSI